MGKTPSVRVRLHRYRGRPYGLIWQCGRQSGEISSGTSDRDAAVRAAGRLEQQLLAGQIPGAGEGVDLPWPDFRARYEREWLEQLSYGSQRGWATAVVHFERICKPRRLSDITKTMLSQFRAGLEELDISAESARSYYRAIRAGLGWAESVDLIDRVPTIRQRRQGRRSKSARCRVITAEEFDRIITAIADDSAGKRGRDVPAIQRFVRGLWHCGLRINELNNLMWEPSAPLHVNIDGKMPLIVIHGQQKNHADSFLPAPPEFWELVEQRGLPRRGHVFAVPGRWGEQITTMSIGKIVAAAGAKAGVIVDPSTGKCATAHDLRAAYLTRLAAKMTPSQTQSLARHSDPKTTSQFYVRHEAEQLARAAGWL